MKRFPKKPLVLLIGIALLLTFTVSGTVAFLADNTAELTNTFTPVEVDTKIIENVSAGAKSSIKVQNIQADNHIPVYVRVAVVGNWVDENGAIVAPWELSAYNTASWTKRSDGFYYYNSVLPVGDTTAELLASGGIKESDYTRPEGADHLVVTVVHQSIQADPASAVTNAWGWTPPASGS